jgi:hypothetical protein
MPKRAARLKKFRVPGFESKAASLQDRVRTLGCRMLRPDRSEVALAMTKAKVVQGEKFL